MPRTAYRALEWIGGADGYLRLLDQTLLPEQVAFRECRCVQQVWEAIKQLCVRGAPAIGIAAAYGAVLAAERGTPADEAYRQVGQAADYLRTSRPTAVNLFWALARMERAAQTAMGKRGVASDVNFGERLLCEAHAIYSEDASMCKAIGAAGAHLIADNSGILTHCNAGALATSEYGTALAVLFAAAERGRTFRVFVDETRPLLQGSRLTAWELQQRDISATVICDNVAAQVMKEGRVQLVIVGADRIAANGDTANKIGTYGVALLAGAHGVPFFVAAPSSTFDLNRATGDTIPIEQRDAREVTHGFGRPTAPSGVEVYNPAFDVTPARLIQGIITEKGLIHPVDTERIRATLSKGVE